MFNLKSKILAYEINELPLEVFELIGVSQVNPYCTYRYENDIFFTLVNFAFEKKEFDEREGLVLAKYFSLRYCPKCKKLSLKPSKIKINCDREYKSNEQMFAYEEYDEPYLAPSIAQGYCSNCSTCFEIKIKSSDLWVKEAKKIKEKDLITKYWEEYQID